MATELKPVYLIAGGDRPKIQRARAPAARADSATRRSSSSPRSRRAAKTPSPPATRWASSEAAAARDRRRTSSAWKAADVKAVAAYLAAPAPDTVLALVGDELKKDSALAKAVAKSGDVLVYDVAKRRPPGMGREQFGERGAKADRGGVPRARRDRRRRPRGARERDRQARHVGRRRADRSAEVEPLAAGRAEAPALRADRRMGTRATCRPRSRAFRDAARALRRPGSTSVPAARRPARGPRRARPRAARRTRTRA